jgi:hypothetical protein
MGEEDVMIGDWNHRAFCIVDGKYSMLEIGTKAYESIPHAFPKLSFDA